MSMKSKTFWFSPRKWFPPHDPIACNIARLCILREDFYLEVLGIVADEISITLPNKPPPYPSFDDNSDSFRRFYFLRNGLKTIYEFKSVLSSLREIRAFRQLLRKHGIYELFLEHLKKLDTNFVELRRLRHALGGHVSHEGVTKALRELSFDDVNKLEIGKTHGDSHYHFAHTICLQMFFSGKNRQNAQEYTDKVMSLFDDIMNIIDHVLGIYLSERKFI